MTRDVATLPTLFLLGVTALAPTLAGPLAAQETTDPALTEWQVPWADTRPRDPYVGPDGRVWFVGQTGDYVGVLDPTSGDFRRFPLEEGAGPHNLVVAPDGGVWYTGNRAAHIGRLDPATGEVRRYDMPDERAQDPHTLMWDAEGDLWFTVQGGNFVGHLDVESGDVRLVEMPQVPGRGGALTSSRPYGIELDSRGRPWIALFNTDAVATVDPSTFERRVIELPEGSRPRRLVVDGEDRVWYVDYAQGQLGRVDPATGDVREWDTPGGSGSRPYGMALDGDGRVWFVETGVSPNRFVGFDPRTEAFFSSVPVESGGGTVRHMYFDADTNTVWFGADTGTIGRAVLPPPRRGVS